MKRAKAAAEPKPKKSRKPPANKLPEPIPEGSVLTDLLKSQWKVGPVIGSGGFGLIYLAQQNSSLPVKDNAEFVMKLEPHENGPLFCELHFYQRAAKADMIKEWATSHHLKYLGVPKFVATGQHERNGVKYRFMVMPRFGTDLQKLFEANGKQFPASAVFLLGLRLMDILEYIHSKGYVHADVKAANLLLNHKDANQVYLVDYGLAFRCIVEGTHKAYKEDPSKAHDGTIEFTSRDAHKGLFPSRRGDLEILGYCMLQWLCSRLPWEDNLQNKNYVRDQKNLHMSKIPDLMQKCLPGKPYAAELGEYLKYVVKMGYGDDPDYDLCRQIFTQALKKLGCKPTDKLDFSAKNSESAKPTPSKVIRKRKDDSSENDLFHADMRWNDGSPSVDEEASQPAAKVRRRQVSKSPRPAKRSRSSLVEDSPRQAVKPKPAGPLKKVGQSPASSAGSRPSKSPAKRGRPTAASRLIKKSVSSIATQTSPGLRGLPRSQRGK